MRVVGHTDDLETAALYLYRDWLPQSGEEARDFPLYCQRIVFFPEVPGTKRLQIYFYRLNKTLEGPPAPSRIKQEISQLYHAKSLSV